MVCFTNVFRCRSIEVGGESVETTSCVRVRLWGAVAAKGSGIRQEMGTALQLVKAYRLCRLYETRMQQLQRTH